MHVHVHVHEQVLREMGEAGTWDALHDAMDGALGSLRLILRLSLAGIADEIGAEMCNRYFAVAAVAFRRARDDARS